VFGRIVTDASDKTDNDAYRASISPVPLAHTCNAPGAIAGKSHRGQIVLSSLRFADLLSWASPKLLHMTMAVLPPTLRRGRAGLSQVTPHSANDTATSTEEPAAFLSQPNAWPPSMGRCFAERLPAAVAGARRMTDENPIRSELMTHQAVRRRTDDPGARGGLDEVANHVSDASLRR
jgi:hypothetical protein